MISSPLLTLCDLAMTWLRARQCRPSRYWPHRGTDRLRFAGNEKPNASWTLQAITSMLFDFPDTQHNQRKNTDRERRHDQHGLSRGHLNAKQVHP
jgi:hypothetical protein